MGKKIIKIVCVVGLSLIFVSIGANANKTVKSHEQIVSELKASESNLTRRLEALEARKENSYYSQGGSRYDEEIAKVSKELDAVQATIDSYEPSLLSQVKKLGVRLKDDFVVGATEGVKQHMETAKNSLKTSADAGNEMLNSATETGKQAVSSLDDIQTLKAAVNTLVKKGEFDELKTRFDKLESRIDKLISDRFLSKKIADALARFMQSSELCKAMNECDGSVGANEILKVIQNPNYKTKSSSSNAPGATR